MSEYYYITNPETKLYVHFKNREYFVDDKLLGACVFNEKLGRRFIEENLDDSWKLTKVIICSKHIPIK